MLVQVNRGHIKRGGSLPDTNPVTLAFYETLGHQDIAFSASLNSIQINNKQVKIPEVSHWLGLFIAGHDVKPFGFNLPDDVLILAAPKHFPTKAAPFRKPPKVAV